MGLHARTRAGFEIPDVPPAHRFELSVVRMEFLAAVTLERNSQADVRVTRRRVSDGLSDRHEERLRPRPGIESGLDTKLLHNFAAHRLERVCTGLDVSAVGNHKPDRRWSQSRTVLVTRSTSRK